MTKNLRLPEQDIVLEIRSLHQPGNLGRLFTIIGQEGGLIGDITTSFIGKTHSIREVTVSVFDEDHLGRVKKAITEKTPTEIVSVRDLVFERHRGGKSTAAGVLISRKLLTFGISTRRASRGSVH